jgi:uncharacterized protein YeaO (DUF488 family)
VKRAYVEPSPQDGYRILADRLSPRGLRKEAARLDLWMKDIAPSDNLRKWFGHDPGRWGEFKLRFFRELDGRVDAVRALQEKLRPGTVVLLFSARDEIHNNAVALKEYLEKRP